MEVSFKVLDICASIRITTKVRPSKEKKIEYSVKKAVKEKIE